MIRLKSVFLVKNGINEPDLWDFVTLDGSRWDNSGFDYFIDKAFQIIAPGESLIRARDFPASAGFNKSFHVPTYLLPRRFEFHGFPVVTDDRLPPSVVDLRSPTARARIVNIEIPSMFKSMVESPVFDHFEERLKREG